LVSIAVADCFDLEYEQIFSTKSFIEIVTARRFVYYILNQHYNFSVNTLCEEFEKTDTSINFGIKHIHNWIKNSEQANKDYNIIITKLSDYETREFER